METDEFFTIKEKDLLFSLTANCCNFPEKPSRRGTAKS